MKMIVFVVDLLNAILALLSAPLAKFQARLGSKRSPLAFRVWDFFGVSPVRHHYYQPIFNVNELPDSLWGRADAMAGVNWNAEGQLALLRSMSYQDELCDVLTVEQDNSLEFFLDNPSYGPADAETLYNMVRHFKPTRVIEIGSGYSTRMMKRALDKNRLEGIESSHVCIEPYEMPWLESMGLDEVIREKVEDVPLETFDSLLENDILFIDSSHVIRTGGDVVAEYLRILPRLKKGVLIHIHDIFLPYEYPREWIVKHRYFWTEQYMLQAFLAFNAEFRVVAAVNWLAREHHQELADACPAHDRSGKGHGAFWIQRV